MKKSRSCRSCPIKIGKNTGLPLTAKIEKVPYTHTDVVKMLLLKTIEHYTLVTSWIKNGIIVAH
jgi:hypothetical protein